MIPTRKPEGATHDARMHHVKGEPQQELATESDRTAPFFQHVRTLREAARLPDLVTSADVTPSGPHGHLPTGPEPQQELWDRITNAGHTVPHHVKPAPEHLDGN